MKKLLSTIISSCLIALFIVSPAGAATYYGCATQEITAADTFKVDSACTGESLTWGSLGDGDVLVANGYTISIANDIGSGSVQVTLTTDGTTYSGIDGGGYTFAINAVAAKTLYIDIVGGTTDVLSVNGAGAGAGTTELTIYGTITGGSGTGDDGIYLTHSAGDVVIGSVALPTTITGGGGTSAHGVQYTSTTGVVTITGNAVGGTAGSGIYCNGSTSGGCTITGNCTGGGGAQAYGCLGGNVTVSVNVIGNIVASSATFGAAGNIKWSPAAPADGVTGNYIKFDGGSAVYAGTNTDDATKALNTFYYIDPTDGSSDVGTATTGGGGAWAF